MFKVKATVIRIMGDEEKYPCHFGYHIGDEIIFDGEKCVGRVCPSLWSLLSPKVDALRAAGPRYVNPAYYVPFWYAAPNVRDPSMKKYDGLGYRTTGEGTYTEPPYSMANLKPKGMSSWPPLEERIVARDVTVMCPDLRTAVLLKLEAFDISDTGFDVLYFRREMTILGKVSKKPGMEIDSILDEFTPYEREVIYPPLHRVMVHILIEELELVGYVRTENGRVTATDKGHAKLLGFKSGLSDEEKKALGF